MKVPLEIRGGNEKVLIIVVVVVFVEWIFPLSWRQNSAEKRLLYAVS